MPTEISRAKLAREIDAWRQQEQAVRARGWFLIRADPDALVVEVAFAAGLASMTSLTPLPVVVACVRLLYDNYDVWPPSLTFINAFTGEPAPPSARALVLTDQGFRNVLLDQHPRTGLPFLCVPGTREYHTHPQHTGDAWLLHRNEREGSIVTISDRIWHTMVRNVTGFRVTTQVLPHPYGVQVDARIEQGDADRLRAVFSKLGPPIAIRTDGAG